MTKGMFMPNDSRDVHVSYLRLSVMSGIITGPYFLSYFKEPGPIEIGTMVAVLEIGAFSTSDLLLTRNPMFSDPISIQSPPLPLDEWET